MAIYRYCAECRTSNQTASKLCEKCKTPLGTKYRIIVKSKGQRVSRTVDSLSRAKEIEATIKSDIIRGEYRVADHRVKKTITLNNIWNKYLDQIKLSKKSWGTDVILYQKYIAPGFGNLELSKVSTLDVERLKHSFKGKNFRGVDYAPATVRHVLLILSRLFVVAAQWGKFDGVNPVSRVTMPKVDNELVRFLDDAQIADLHRILDLWPYQEYADVIRFLMFTGCRRGEAYSLKWEHVDLPNGLITLFAPKGGKTTTIPISSKVIAILKSTERTESPFVFPGGTRDANNLSNHWKRIRKEACLPSEFRLHDLRHQFASSLVSNGVDLYTVSKLLTHKNPNITKKYSHLSDDALRAAANRAGELVGKKVDNVVLFEKKEKNA